MGKIFNIQQPKRAHPVAFTYHDLNQMTMTGRKKPLINFPFPIGVLQPAKGFVLEKLPVRRNAHTSTSLGILI